MAAGKAFGIRPAGMLALDVVRLEAGLILLEVDYTSSMHALIAAQSYSPGEIGLGRLVSLDKDTPFVGQTALRREAAAGGPSRPRPAAHHPHPAPRLVVGGVGVRLLRAGRGGDRGRPGRPGTTARGAVEAPHAVR